MSISLILLIIAGILVVLDLVLWNAGRGYSRVLLTPVAVLFIVIALLVSGGGIHA